MRQRVVDMEKRLGRLEMLLIGPAAIKPPEEQRSEGRDFTPRADNQEQSQRQ